MACEFLEIHSENPNKRIIKKAVDVLLSDGLIIYPTDTVYSLGCSINNLSAMNRLARLKKTSLKKARFSIVCNDLSHLSEYCKQIDRSQYKLLKRAFPGPFTFILPAAKSLPLAYKDHKTVGIRVPNHEVPQTIVSLLGSPIVSTSVHDEEDELMDYITEPSLIYEKYKNQVDLILDAGPGELYASTVIDLCTEPYEILREGKGDIDIIY